MPPREPEGEEKGMQTPGTPGFQPVGEWRGQQETEKGH